MISHKESTFPSLNPGFLDDAANSNAYSLRQTSLKLKRNVPSRLGSTPSQHLLVSVRDSNETLGETISEYTLPFMNVKTDIEPFRKKLCLCFSHTPVHHHNGSNDFALHSNNSLIPSISLKRKLSSDTLNTDDSSFCTDRFQCSTPIHSPILWGENIATGTFSPPALLRKSPNKGIEMLETGLVDFPDSIMLPDLDLISQPSSRFQQSDNIHVPRRKCIRLSMKPRPDTI